MIILIIGAGFQCTKMWATLGSGPPVRRLRETVSFLHKESLAKYWVVSSSSRLAVDIDVLQFRSAASGPVLSVA
jgi:hypothetical protein